MRISAARLALLLSAALVVLILSSPRVEHWLAVDSCLDLGGSFDYVAGICDFSKSHPFAPQPWLTWWGVVAATGASLVMAGVFMWRDRRRA
jgi:hypothetical protein